MPELKPGRRGGGALADGWRQSLEDYPRALAWRADGMALHAADAAGQLYCLDARSGQCHWRVQAHVGAVLVIAANPTRPVLVSGGEDGYARVWRADDGSAITDIAARGAWVEHVAWSPDGERLAIASGRHATVHLHDGTPTAPPCAHVSTLSGLTWLHDRRLGTACYGGAFEWDAVTGERVVHHAWRGAPTGLVVSPDAAVIACGGQDSSVHFWRRRTGDDAEMRGYTAKPTALAFDRGSRWLASNGGEDVTVWSFEPGGPEGSTPLTLRMHTANVTSLAFSPRHALLASGARDGTVCLWQFGAAHPGRLVGAAMMDAPVVGLAWRPDGRGLATLGKDGALQVWRVRPEQTLDAPSISGRMG